MPRLRKNKKEQITDNLIGNISFFKTFYHYSDERIRNIIGVGETTYRTRRNEPETFGLKELIKLADSFNCSIADLLTIRRE